MSISTPQKDTVVHLYENVYIPKTRLETRIEYKLKRDTIRMITTRRGTKGQSRGPKQIKKLTMWVWIIGVCSAGFV